jgi:hypothetical protein
MDLSPASPENESALTLFQAGPASFLVSIA